MLAIAVTVIDNDPMSIEITFPDMREQTPEAMEAEFLELKALLDGIQADIGRQTSDLAITVADAADQPDDVIELLVDLHEDVERRLKHVIGRRVGVRGMYLDGDSNVDMLNADTCIEGRITDTGIDYLPDPTDDEAFDIQGHRMLVSATVSLSRAVEVRRDEQGGVISTKPLAKGICVPLVYAPYIQVTLIPAHSEYTITFGGEVIDTYNNDPILKNLLDQL